MYVIIEEEMVTVTTLGLGYLLMIVFRSVCSHTYNALNAGAKPTGAACFYKLGSEEGSIFRIFNPKMQSTELYYNRPFILNSAF